MFLGPMAMEPCRSKCWLGTCGAVESSSDSFSTFHILQVYANVQTILLKPHILTQINSNNPKE